MSDQRIEVLKALGDSVRIDLVRTIAAKRTPISGCDITSSCTNTTRLSQPTLSHHFAKLVSAGVLIERKDGTSKSYVINHRLLTDMGIDIKKLTE